MALDPGQVLIVLLRLLLHVHICTRLVGGHWYLNIATSCLSLLKDEYNIAIALSRVVQFLHEPLCMPLHDFIDCWRKSHVHCLVIVSRVNLVLQRLEVPIASSDAFRLVSLLSGSLLRLHLGDKFLVHNLILDPLLVRLQSLFSCLHTGDGCRVLLVHASLLRWAILRGSYRRWLLWGHSSSGISDVIFCGLCLLFLLFHGF